jgi:hypothetical protein
VHNTVLVQDKSVPDTEKLLDSPVHDTVGPEGGDGTGHSTSSSLQSNLSKGGTDELLGGRDHHGRLADLGHGGGDKVSDNELGGNTVGLQLRAESGRPVLKESLGSRVGSEKRRRKESTEGSHGEDKTTLASDHSRSDNLGNLEGSLDVDGDNVLHLDIGSLKEGNGHIVGLSDVVDQDCNIKSVDELRETLVVVVVVLCKVHSEGLGLDTGEFGGDLGSKSFELGGGTGNENNVEALLRQLNGELLANTVGSTSDHGPGTLWSILAELCNLLVGLRAKITVKHIRWYR